MKRFVELKFFSLLTLIYLAIGVLSRMALWALYARDTDTSVSMGKLLGILPMGILNDLAAVLPFLFLFLLYLILLPNAVKNWRLVRGLWLLLTFAFVYGMLFISGAEIAFFDEFASRFNLIAVSYLIYPTEVIGNIKESYPLWILLPVIGLASLVIYFPLRRQILDAPLKQKLDRAQRLRSAAALFVPATCCLLFVGPKSLYQSRNHIAEELAANGVSSFLSALRNMNIDFEQYYKMRPISETAVFVREQLTLDGSRFASNDPLDLNRIHTAEKPLDAKKKLNVVILAEESLGAEYIESLQGRKGNTPFLDSFARESLSFTNAFATGTRTVRGLEAISSSFPPVPSESIVKQKESNGISTIGSILRRSGYSTSFIYGGYGIFDNMNRFFADNGFEISDRSDISNPKFSNIWGVSDEDLFQHALRYFREKNSRGQPFFGLVLSTSNHKPYTFPPNPVGIPESGGGREAGVRYADYALRRFFEEVKKEPWYEDTIFVVIADHDARVYGKAEIPVNRYRIPAIFHSPKYLASSVNPRFFSQLDVAPTLLGMLGIDYTAPFYGQDVLSAAYETNAEKRWVPLNHNFNIGLYNRKRLLVLGLNREAQARDCIPLTASLQSEVSQSKTSFLPEEEPLLEGYFLLAYKAFRERRY